MTVFLNLLTRSVIVFLIVISMNTAMAANSYREWFLYPQKYSNIITGYSYRGLSAKEDAAAVYNIYRECIVKGTYEVFDSSSEKELLQNSDYFYYFSPDSSDKTMSRLIEADHFDINLISGDYITAFGIDSSAIFANISFPVIDANGITKPDWEKYTFFEDDLYYYGVGKFTTTGNENDGWKTAEEQAVFNILTNVAVEVHNVNYYSPGSDTSGHLDEIEGITILKLMFRVRNISIVQRYPDFNNQLFFVLARIFKTDIYSPMLNRTHSQ
ncbi:MAG: hypothetical protein AB7T22_01065 [Calditrichaceae bacterium]